jgi:hypothetical protein
VPQEVLPGGHGMYFLMLWELGFFHLKQFSEREGHPMLVIVEV